MKMIVQQRFLVSFMVDARGGAMRGCRHSGVRVIIPPRKASMPMRITCRYLKKDKLVHAPPLMEGEALASRILEMGPAGAKFLGPVILEVPHFASLRGKEREIVILRSDNGETWREHTLEATEDAVQEVLNESFDGEELKQLEELNTTRITRILTTDFPQYFAIVTRIRQEVHAIGPDGGMVSSTVVPQVQAVFPQGALTKKIKVGLQAQPISPDLAAKLLGNRVAVSPIVTVEPRRRKFHKPITLTLPVPQAASKGMINQYSGDAPTLRLLCSITGGTTRAQWEDVTGSTPLTFVNDCVSFTTTVSARFWLMDCTNIPEATRMATELYREAIHVPFMSKFVVFAKRHQLEEARMRVFCVTDDREDKTLETQEQFIEVAKSRDVEVLEGKTQYLEFAGNLVPITKSGDQLAFNFYAFRENRLPFTVRVKDQHTESVGRVAFMRQPKVGRGDAPQNPICNLNIELPETIQPEPAPSEPDLLSLEKKYTFLSISKADTIHKADLRLSDISNMLDHDWVSLARELDISDSDINIIKSQYPDNSPQQALVMLRLWMQTAGNKATGNALEKGLRKIDRVDIVNQCIFNVEPVTDDKERAVAKAQIDTTTTTTTSTAGGLNVTDSSAVARKERDVNRDASMDVSYDEHDLMKEAESADEDEDNQKSYQGKEALAQVASDLSPTYETEEKKYAAEEKIVKEETKALKSQITQEDVDEFLKDTELTFEKKLKEMSINKEIFEKVPAEYAGKSEIVEEDFVKTVADRSKEEPVLQSATTMSLLKSKQEPFDESSFDKKVDIPEKNIETTVTKHVFDDGSQSIITTKTTQRKSFIIDDDDGSGVEEKIVLEKRTDSEDLEQEFRKLSPSESSAAKSEILQKLGEELGKLDDRLEEKFKEKRRAGQPDEADNQAAHEAEVIIQPRTKTVVATHFQVVDEPEMVKTQLTSPVDVESTITAVAAAFETDAPVSAPHDDEITARDDIDPYAATAVGENTDAIIARDDIDSYAATAAVENTDAIIARDDIDPYAATAAVENANATSDVCDATDVTKESIIVDVGSEEQLSPKVVTEMFSSSSEEPASLGSSAAIDCSEPVSSEEVALLDNNDAPVTRTPPTSEGNSTVKIAEPTPTTPTTSIHENEDDTMSGQILSDELTQTSVDKMASQEAPEVARAEALVSSTPSLQSAEEALVKQTQKTTEVIPAEPVPHSDVAATLQKQDNNGTDDFVMVNPYALGVDDPEEVQVDIDGGVECLLLPAVDQLQHPAEDSTEKLLSADEDDMRIKEGQEVSDLSDEEQSGVMIEIHENKTEKIQQDNSNEYQVGDSPEMPDDAEIEDYVQSNLLPESLQVETCEYLSEGELSDSQGDGNKFVHGTDRQGPEECMPEPYSVDTEGLEQGEMVVEKICEEAYLQSEQHEDETYDEGCQKNTANKKNKYGEEYQCQDEYKQQQQEEHQPEKNGSHLEFDEEIALSGARREEIALSGARREESLIARATGDKISKDQVAVVSANEIDEPEVYQQSKEP